MLSFHYVIASALHYLGDHEEELKAAREARGRFPDRLEPALWEARALVGLGRLDEAREVIGEGMTLPSPLGSAGYLQVHEGLELRRHGFPERGREVLRRGIAWYKAGPQAEEHRYGLARAQLWAGESGAAAEQFRRLSEAEPERLDYAGYLGLSLAACGRWEEAREVDARLASWPDPFVRGRHLYWRATIAAETGALDEAVSLLRDALAQGVSHASLHENEDLSSLWKYPPFQALLEPRG
jgi:tetratricopeptide (TPR) repeat protein